MSTFARSVRQTVLAAVMACSAMLAMSSCATAAEAKKSEPATAGYLFAHFRGERSNEWEQIFCAVSRDGAKWEALNDGKSVLQSNLGEGGVRDPFAVRNPETGRAKPLTMDKISTPGSFSCPRISTIFPSGLR